MNLPTSRSREILYSIVERRRGAARFSWSEPGRSEDSLAVHTTPQELPDIEAMANNKREPTLVSISAILSKMHDEQARGMDVQLRGVSDGSRRGEHRAQSYESNGQGGHTPDTSQGGAAEEGDEDDVDTRPSRSFQFVRSSISPFRADYSRSSSGGLDNQLSNDRVEDSDDPLSDDRSMADSTPAPPSSDDYRTSKTPRRSSRDYRTMTSPTQSWSSLNDHDDRSSPIPFPSLAGDGLPMPASQSSNIPPADPSSPSLPADDDEPVQSIPLSIRLLLTQINTALYDLHGCFLRLGRIRHRAAVKLSVLCQLARRVKLERVSARKNMQRALRSIKQTRLSMKANMKLKEKSVKVKKSHAVLGGELRKLKKGRKVERVHLGKCKKDRLTERRRIVKSGAEREDRRRDQMRQATRRPSWSDGVLHDAPSLLRLRGGQGNWKS